MEPLLTTPRTVAAS